MLLMCLPKEKSLIKLTGSMVDRKLHMVLEASMLWNALLFLNCQLIQGFKVVVLICVCMQLLWK